jgi:hypothetical protein
MVRMEVDMAYFPSASRGSRRVAALSPTGSGSSGPLAYVVFALAFVFTGALVLGLIP